MRFLAGGDLMGKHMNNRGFCKGMLGMLVLVGVIGLAVFSGCSFAAVTASDADMTFIYQERQWFRVGKIDGQYLLFQFPDGTEHGVTLRASDTLGTLYYTADDQKQPFMYTGEQQDFYVCCLRGHFLGLLFTRQQGRYYTTLLDIGHIENRVPEISGKCSLSECTFTETGITLQAGNTLYGGLADRCEIQVAVQEQLSYEKKELGVDSSCAYRQYLKRDLCAARQLTLFEGNEEVSAQDTADSFFTIPAGTELIFSDYKALNSIYSAYQVQTDTDQGWIICDQSGALMLQGADIKDVFSSEKVSETTVTGPEANPSRRFIWTMDPYGQRWGETEIVDTVELSAEKIGIVRSDESYYLTYTYETRMGKSCLVELPEGASDFICVEGYGTGGHMEITQYMVEEQAYTSVFINVGLWFLPLHFCEEQPDGTYKDLGVSLPEQLIVVEENGTVDFPTDNATLQDETAAFSDVKENDQPEDFDEDEVMYDAEAGTGVAEFSLAYAGDVISCRTGITSTGDRILEFVTESGTTQWKLVDVNHLVRQ